MEKAQKKHIVGDEDLFTTELIQDFEPSPLIFSWAIYGERVDELSHKCGFETKISCNKK
jgi:hypothetical protein